LERSGCARRNISIREQLLGSSASDGVRRIVGQQGFYVRDRLRGRAGFAGVELDGSAALFHGDTGLQRGIRERRFRELGSQSKPFRLSAVRVENVEQRWMFPRERGDVPAGIVGQRLCRR
jgi:hypothetical protein